MSKPSGDQWYTIACEGRFLFCEEFQAKLRDFCRVAGPQSCDWHHLTDDEVKKKKKKAAKGGREVVRVLFHWTSTGTSEGATKVIAAFRQLEPFVVGDTALEFMVCRHDDCDVRYVGSDEQIMASKSCWSLRQIRWHSRLLLRRERKELAKFVIELLKAKNDSR